MWTNNVRSQIELYSPNGSRFTALWRNNPRSFEKKLGVFDMPKFTGSIVQDMDVRSNSYTLVIYFQGFNHDKEANDFYEAMRTERGQWEIIHPTKGSLILQLVSCTENIDPTGNGNYTEFTTEWLEPANVERIASSDELFSSIFAAVDAVETALVVAQQIRADTYSAIQSAINTFNKITGLADKIIGEIAATSTITEDAFQSALVALNASIAAFDANDPDLLDISQGTADLLSVPSSLASFENTYSAYNDFFDETELIENGTIDATNTKQFNFILVFVNIARCTLSAEFSTRVAVVSAMENITDLFSAIMTALDDLQEEFSTGDIDEQFFTQTENYQDVYNLFALTLRYLIAQFYNLNAEKRFTLKNARSPLEITVTEYGTLGEDDENYDLFITSNQLSGNEILLIPEGREVVIYV